MRSKKANIPRKLLHSAMFVCIISLCFASIGIAFAKYNSEASGSDGASAAQFSPSLSSDENIDVSGIKRPGDVVEKTFQVHNSSGGKPSEVTMKYKIILKTTGNLPLTFTLLDGGENSVAVWNCDGISGKQEYIYEVDSLCFNAGTVQQHDYKLKVEWQDDRKDSGFSGKTDAVYLSVTWEQID